MCTYLKKYFNCCKNLSVGQIPFSGLISSQIVYIINAISSWRKQNCAPKHKKSRLK